MKSIKCLFTYILLPVSGLRMEKADALTWDDLNGAAERFNFPLDRYAEPLDTSPDDLAYLLLVRLVTWKNVNHGFLQYLAENIPQQQLGGLVDSRASRMAQFEHENSAIAQIIKPEVLKFHVTNDHANLSPLDRVVDSLAKIHVETHRVTADGFEKRKRLLMSLMMSIVGRTTLFDVLHGIFLFLLEYAWTNWSCDRDDFKHQIYYIYDMDVFKRDMEQRLFGHYPMTTKFNPVMLLFFMRYLYDIAVTNYGCQQIYQCAVDHDVQKFVFFTERLIGIYSPKDETFYSHATKLMLTCRRVSVMLNRLGPSYFGQNFCQGVFSHLSAFALQDWIDKEDERLARWDENERLARWDEKRVKPVRVVKSAEVEQQWKACLIM